jgi:hypothetical protein
MFMNRRILVITGVSIGLLLSLATLAIFWPANGDSKLTVSFVNAEASLGPAFSNDPCERLAFAVRNDGKAPVPFVVSDIKDEYGNWLAFFHKLDDADAGKTTRLYLYVPKGSHPQAVRLRGFKKANAFEKAQFALEIVSKKIRGSYTGKQIWFGELSEPAYEFVVKTDTKAEFGGTNQSRPVVGLGTNLTSAAADSGR